MDYTDANIKKHGPVSKFVLSFMKEYDTWRQTQQYVVTHPIETIYLEPTIRKPLEPGIAAYIIIEDRTFMDPNEVQLATGAVAIQLNVTLRLVPLYKPGNEMVLYFHDYLDRLCLWLWRNRFGITQVHPHGANNVNVVTGFSNDQAYHNVQFSIIIIVGEHPLPVHLSNYPEINTTIEAIYIGTNGRKHESVETLVNC